MHSGRVAARTDVGVAALLVLLLNGAQVVAQRPAVAGDGGCQVQHAQRRRRRVVEVLAVRLRAAKGPGQVLYAKSSRPVSLARFMTGLQGRV